jgi:uncharacterized protein (DUF3820 family)
MIKHTDKINFGIHKGKQFIDIPAEYLLHLKRKKIAFGDVLKYIDNNFDFLIQEEKQHQKK